MSLGLDALNKLQRMRAETAAMRSATVLPPAALPRPQTNRLLVAAAIFSLGLATAALFRSRDRVPEPRVAGEPAAQAFAPAPVSAAPRPAPQLPPATPAALLAAPVPTISYNPLAPVTFSAAPAAVLPKARVQLVPTRAPVPRTRVPTQSPLIASFIAKGIVGGVDDGASGGRPVVMFNDSLYHLNDMVNSALGVRLIEIRTNRLTFQDAHGVLYVRNLFPL